MMTRPGSSVNVLSIVPKASILFPIMFIEGVRFANGAELSWTGVLGRTVFTIGMLSLAWLCKMVVLDSGKRVFPYHSLILVGLVAASGLIYWIWRPTWVAWLLVGSLYSLLLVWSEVTGGKQGWLVTGAFSLVAGVLPVAAMQMETRFSEEEFYVALQAALFIVYWLFLQSAWRWAFPTRPDRSPQKGFRIPALPMLTSLSVLAIVGLLYTLRLYQDSFFPPTAPLFPGISETEPFLCGQVEGDVQVYKGSEVYQGMLERVMAQPGKEAPDYALLALETNDQSWIAAYKEALLQEASAGAFAQPAQSIKYGQYQAALRIYFFSLLQAAHPELFDAQEEELLQNWFRDINQRAQTVEWVDWMYAVAFRVLPKGPYENQETGAGLLSLLVANRLGEASLSTENQAYLAERGGGWEASFRNTDDAIIYQPEWINNAYFQSLYRGSFNIDNARLAFEWLLLQSPPDGSPLSYNHIGLVHLAAPAYLGAELVQDERLLWLAGRSLDYLQANDLPIRAQPGMEKIVGMEGVSPDRGSCLIYGNSGVPTRSGPLAPDKIVFRDGWESDANYLLLNLRFTGWHRYKATNSIVLVGQAGPLIEEQTSGETFAWLPSGRSLFRDKRIPRENLNGLLIQRNGLSAVIVELSGVGSYWAQDPPPYARVERFETLPGYDMSSTIIDNWHGWRHQRTIHFYHQGPIVVIDAAKGRAGDQSALVWHTTSNQALAGNRLLIRDGAEAAEMVLLPLQVGQLSSSFSGSDGNSELRVAFQPAETGSLELATIFLTGEWVSAQVDLVDEDGMRQIKIATPQREILLPVEEPGNE